MGRKKGTQEETTAMMPIRARALDALLDSATLTEAAEKAGISRKTLYSYLRNDADFALAFKEAQERLTLEHVEAIEANRQRATDAIFALMDDEKQPGIVRLKAAQAILEATEAEQKRARIIMHNNVEANKSPFDFGFGGRND